MSLKIGGTPMVILVAKPDIVKFLEHLTILDFHGTQIFEIMSDNLPKRLHIKPIRVPGNETSSGANIIGF
jgi:hypothetical protein